MKKSTTLRFSRFALGLMFITAFALTGCLREDSENVNQDRIWGHYELFYDGNDDVTYVRATFRFGHALGTKLELTEPSNVKFNGSEITFRPALAMYERSFPGFIPSGTFEFTDTDGNTFINDVEIRTIEQPFEVGPIDRTQAFAYPWQGDPISSRETVTLTLRGGNNGGTEVFNTAAIGATELTLGVSQLQQLSTGNGTAVLDRVYNPPIAQATSAGGLLWGKYRAPDKTVVIE
jgi:hypothetical protein